MSLNHTRIQGRTFIIKGIKKSLRIKDGNKSVGESSVKINVMIKRTILTGRFSPVKYQIAIPETAMTNVGDSDL